ncbi:MAG: hypothetical protein KAS32_22350 [Candidatus Peribacteraceae bacterium]|nr:hypothetical protein [Candidatus Peribacteraceae bacterium]
MAETQTKHTSYTPEEEADQVKERKERFNEENLLHTLEKWFEESKEYISPHRERMRMNNEQYNNQIDMYVPTGGTELRFNMQLSDVETQLSVVGDGLPDFDVQPEEEDDTFFADSMNKRAKQACNRDTTPGLKYVSLETIKDSLILGNGILSIKDEERIVGRSGEGGAKKVLLNFNAVDMSTFFPSPDCIGLDIRTECRYLGFAVPVNCDKLYMETGRMIKPEGYLDENDTFYILTIDNNEEDDKESATKADAVIVKEWYFMDFDTEKYPNGRCVVWANGVKLDDYPLGDVKYDATEEDTIDDNPKNATVKVRETGDRDELYDANYTEYMSRKSSIPESVKKRTWTVQKEDISLVPYRLIKNYGSSHDWKGIGEPELINTISKCLNEILSAIADNIRYTGNPILLKTKNFISKFTAMFTGLPGDQIEVDKPDDLSWLVPPGMPAYIFRFIEILITLHDFVTGMHDILRGKRESGITAASALALLQEVAQQRIRHKIKHTYSLFFKSVGEYVVWMLQAKDEAVLQLKQETLKKEGESSFVEYDPVGRYTNTEDIETAEATDDEKTGKTMKDSKFNIDVVAGARVPEGSVAAEQLATEKYEKGLYTYEDWVARSSEPDKEKLLKNHNEANQLQGFIDRIGQINDAVDEFFKLAKTYYGIMVSDEPGANDEYNKSIIEEEMMQITIGFPEILRMREFLDLPKELKQRLLTPYMADKDTLQEVT